MRTHLFHAIVSGLIAGAAGIVYNKVYSELLWVDFLAVINPISILGACLVGCISASLGYYALSLSFKRGLDPIFNVIFLLLSFASISVSFGFELPLDIEQPELFPGLSAALHLFPLLFWLLNHYLSPLKLYKHHLNAGLSLLRLAHRLS